MDIRSQDNMAV